LFLTMHDGRGSWPLWIVQLKISHGYGVYSRKSM